MHVGLLVFLWKGTARGRLGAFSFIILLLVDRLLSLLFVLRTLPNDQARDGLERGALRQS